MADDTGKRSVSISSAIGIWKDVVSSSRDSALLLLVLLLLAFPTSFNSILVKAGFEEGSFVGFKWKSKLVDSDAALKEARTTIADLQQKNNEMAKALAEANANVNDPSLKERIAKLEAENKQLQESTQKVQDSVSSTIASNALLVDKALSSMNANKWGVVFSGDATLEGARYEVDTIAPKLGLLNPSIYLRKGSYRSVSVVGDKQQADQILPQAKRRREDAYIVNMSSWCPNPTQRTGYLECTSS
jgi:hypothetical protein